MYIGKYVFFEVAKINEKKWGLNYKTYNFMLNSIVMLNNFFHKYFIHVNTLYGQWWPVTCYFKMFC